MAELKPFYEDVQAHYDLSDDFFALFLDPSMTYSCAYFEPEGVSLGEAQLAKIDLALGKLELRPGERLLDIGCGWGATVRRAAERHGVHAVGLTLSRNQQRTAAERTAGLPVEIRLMGWEEFDEPVDAIVSIGAFEHFRIDRYPAFFGRCREVLPPAGGRMLLHTILQSTPDEIRDFGAAITHEDVKFTKFILKHIFPGGQLCDRHRVEAEAARAGFELTRFHSLRPHYAKTLDAWAAALSAQRDAAIRLTSSETYDIYMRYLTGCADLFRAGKIDIAQFTLRVV